MCPVHVLWPFFKEFDVGVGPFAGITPAMALATLRRYLCRLGVAEANIYRTHDFRRGHADDLRESGASLHEILLAGEWRGPAFMRYMNLVELEAGAVVQAHVDESSSEDEDAC